MSVSAKKYQSGDLLTQKMKASKKSIIGKIAYLNILYEFYVVKDMNIGLPDIH